MSSTPEVPTISGLTHVIAGTAHSPCYARSNYGWRSPAHVLTISHLILSFLQLIVCVCSLISPTRRRKQLIKTLSLSSRVHCKNGLKNKDSLKSSQKHRRFLCIHATCLVPALSWFNFRLRVAVISRLYCDFENCKYSDNFCTIINVAIIDIFYHVYYV